MTELPDQATFNLLFSLELIKWIRTQKIFEIILDIMYSYLISNFRRNVTSMSLLNMTVDFTLFLCHIKSV